MGHVEHHDTLIELEYLPTIHPGIDVMIRFGSAYPFLSLWLTLSAFAIVRIAGIAIGLD